MQEVQRSTELLLRKKDAINGEALVGYFVVIAAWVGEARNVYKAAVAYAVGAWLLIQIVTQVFPFFEIPNWAVRVVVFLLILGFPFALWLGLSRSFRRD